MTDDNAPSPSAVAIGDPDPTNVRGRRIGAVFIDFALLLIPSLVIASSFHEKRTDITSCDQIEATLKSCITLGDNIYVATDGRIVAWQFLGALLGIAYYVIMQGLTGWTVGKRLVGIRVVNAAGEVCGVPRALVRYLPFLVPVLIPVVGPAVGGLIALAEFILILAHRRHQRMGDLMAKTFVVRHEALGHPVPAG